MKREVAKNHVSFFLIQKPTVATLPEGLICHSEQRLLRRRILAGWQHRILRQTTASASQFFLRIFGRIFSTTSNSTLMSNQHFDIIIIGSGMGGGRLPMRCASIPVPEFCCSGTEIICRRSRKTGSLPRSSTKVATRPVRNGILEMMEQTFRRGCTITWN